MRICLQRRETIHPAAENVAKRHLGTPRRETTDVVGKELLLFRCTSGRESDSVIAMDLPFVLFIPFGRGGEESNRRIPPASLQLPSRIAETYYELVVTVQQGASVQNKYAFPIPLQRYDTLSTFGMYNRPETKAVTVDNLVTLAMSLPRWSYGPLDPIAVYLKLTPNPDWMTKAKRVTIQKITLSIEEEITFNPEGDEPTKKINKIAKHTQPVGTKLPESGYVAHLGLVFPSKDLRDPEGIIKRGKPAFPMYQVTSFTTTSTLYKIEFYLNIKVSRPPPLVKTPSRPRFSLGICITYRRIWLRPATSRSANSLLSVRWTSKPVRRKWTPSNRQRRMLPTWTRTTPCSRLEGSCMRVKRMPFDIWASVKSEERRRCSSSSYAAEEEG